MNQGEQPSSLRSHKGLALTPDFVARGPIASGDDVFGNSASWGSVLTGSYFPCCSMARALEKKNCAREQERLVLYQVWEGWWHPGYGKRIDLGRVNTT